MAWWLVGLSVELYSVLINREKGEYFSGSVA